MIFENKKYIPVIIISAVFIALEFLLNKNYNFNFWLIIILNILSLIISNHYIIKYSDNILKQLPQKMLIIRNSVIYTILIWSINIACGNFLKININYILAINILFLAVYYLSILSIENYKKYSIRTTEDIKNKKIDWKEKIIYLKNKDENKFAEIINLMEYSDFNNNACEELDLEIYKLIEEINENDEEKIKELKKKIKKRNELLKLKK